MTVQAAPIANGAHAAGVEQSSRWSCDIYTGTSAALIKAGIISREQLKSQKGRAPGVTAFLASGEPCPPRMRAWRDPGYTVIRQQEDGGYRVEITAPKEVQAQRRRAEKEIEHEREQQRLNDAVAECGQQYRNWALKHGYTSDPHGITRHADYEWWEGTKEQLQSEGIGCGMAFPGEPGGPSELYCKCPLGFDVRVYLPGSSYAPGKVAARIYTAQSWYVPREAPPKQYVQHAPGVLLEVWTPAGWKSRDFYYGSADALTAAGLVPSQAYFPGQPGMNRQQASYRKGWAPANCSPHNDFGATIRMRGKAGHYCLELPVTDAEEKRREQISRQQEEERTERAKVLAVERKQLRDGMQPEMAEAEFRASRIRLAEMSVKLVWSTVFARSEGGLSFDIPEDSESWDDLAEAFQTIRNVARSAEVLRGKKQEAAARTRLALVAARKDTGLQSVLQNARHLRLVRSNPEEE
ncbi:MAG: hypothetical protein V4864_16120 [Pseudomonadota bacterium]